MTGLARLPGCYRRFQLSTDERGAVLIQVTVMLVVLLGFCGFVVDYGVLWVARAQAQNAADAGALAAATALAFDQVATTTFAEQDALQVVSSIPVWNQVPTATVTFGDCGEIPRVPVLQPRTTSSATVSVYRDGTHGSEALPSYFARFLGVTEQGVQAHATACTAPANTATCVWPVAIPDNFRDFNSTIPPEKSGTETFRRYLYPLGPPNTVEDIGLVSDFFSPPTFDGDSTATGYKISNLTLGVTPDPSVTIGRLLPAPALTTHCEPMPSMPSRFDCIDKQTAVAVQLSGARGFAADLASCNQQPVHIGDILPRDPGATFADVISQASNRYSQDSGATWNSITLRIRGSCAASNSCSPIASISPRLVVLPLFDPDRYDQTRGVEPVLRIVNFAGFFIDSVSGGQISGHLTTYPGIVDVTPPFGNRAIAYEWALLRTSVLTR